MVLVKQLRRDEGDEGTDNRHGLEDLNGVRINMVVKINLADFSIGIARFQIL